MTENTTETGAEPTEETAAEVAAENTAAAEAPAAAETSDEAEAPLTYEQLQARAKNLIKSCQEVGCDPVALVKEQAGL